MLKPGVVHLTSRVDVDRVLLMANLITGGWIGLSKNSSTY
jgi:hypothetical protein